MSRLVALLALASLALATFASFPALRGGRVYDDVALPAGPLVDELADLGRTFWLTSFDYRAAVESNPLDVSGVTYRPVSQASLILTAHLGGGMRAHHLTSLALHALTALLVGVAILRAKKPVWLALLGAGIVVAHPATIEAYAWVAGRADLVAGLCLVIVAVAIPAKLERVQPLGLVVGAVALVAGTLAKETFVLLGPIVATRGLWAHGSTRNGRIAALLVALTPAISLALMWTRIHQETVVIPDSADLLVWLRRAPRVIGDATVTWLLPYRRAMRTLAFEAYSPVGATTILGCGAFGVAFAASLSEKKFGLALVLVGNAATLIVSSHVADHFWLGFDRFLYAPLVALVVTAAESWETAPSALPRPAAFGLVVGVVVLAGIAHLSARAYSSQEAFVAALMRDRPNDPSGQFLESRRYARENDLIEALVVLEDAKPTTSPALERERAVRQFVTGHQELTSETMRRIETARPFEPMVAADALTVAIAKRHFFEIPSLAETANGRIAARRVACLALKSKRRRAAFEPEVDETGWYEQSYLITEEI